MTKRRKKLLQYWTTRYVAVVCIGLVIITFVFIILINKSAFNHKIENMRSVTQVTANYMNSSKEIPFPTNKKNDIPPFKEHYMYKLDSTGEVISHSSSKGPKFVFSHAFLKKDNGYTKVKNKKNGKNYIAVSQSIKNNKKIEGYIVLVEQEDKPAVPIETYGILFILMLTLALLSWGVIYFLTKSLSQPIIQIAQAAQKIKNNQYDIVLPNEKPQKEVNDLVQSFRTMSERLEYLEKLRAELLTSVTHELKTPVTSISGLLRAIDDGVVDKQETKIFMKTALDETNRLQIMVSDLLEFNSFSAESISTTMHDYNLYKSTFDFVNNFKLINNAENIIHIKPDINNIWVKMDIYRYQQILTNILKNALDAIQKNEPELGYITITLQKNKNHAVILIEDNGKGILKTDQQFIFERFYRGENKKFQTRGLGIGLAFSKVLAKAMNGDLYLVGSRPGRTLFSLYIPITQVKNNKEIPSKSEDDH